MGQGQVMADGVTLLVGVSALVLLLVLLGVAVHIYADVGLRVFFWPRLDHGHEIQHAARLAALPWYILSFLIALNGLSVLLFAHNLLFQPATGFGFWFVAMLLPILMVHLLDYRRSRLAALLTFLLLVAAVGALGWFAGARAGLLFLAPLLLWSLNGVRATFADRTFA